MHINFAALCSVRHVTASLKRVPLDLRRAAASAAPVPVAAAPAPAPAPAAAAPPPPAVAKGVEVTSPMAGTFYRKPAPGEPLFAKEGDRVKKGQTVCIIEAMKLMNEIEVGPGKSMLVMEGMVRQGTVNLEHHPIYCSSAFPWRGRAASLVMMRRIGSVQVRSSVKYGDGV